MEFQDLMAGPPPTYLPEDPAAADLVAGTGEGEGGLLRRYGAC
jgi:hypothetical protein